MKPLATLHSPGFWHCHNLMFMERWDLPQRKPGDPPLSDLDGPHLFGKPQALRPVPPGLDRRTGSDPGPRGAPGRGSGSWLRGGTRRRGGGLRGQGRPPRAGPGNGRRPPGPYRRGLYLEAGRSTRDLLANVNDLKLAGCRLVATSQGLDTAGDAVGNLLLTILAGVAEFERETLRGRAHLGLARARAKGKQFGRPRVDGPTADQVAACRARGLPWSPTATELGCKATTARRRLAA
jgi:Resolvase, N terminal domain